MPNLPFCGLRSVLDFGFQLWLDPDAFVRDPLREGLRFPGERLQPPPELRGRGLVEAVVDLARVDEIVALPPADVKAVPLGAVEGEAGDCQRLALRASLLHPIVAAAAHLRAVADLGDHAFQPQFAGVREHILAFDFEALAELDIGPGDDLFELRLSLAEGKLPQITAVQVVALRIISAGEANASGWSPTGTSRQAANTAA